MRASVPFLHTQSVPTQKLQTARHRQVPTQTLQQRGKPTMSIHTHGTATNGPRSGPPERLCLVLSFIPLPFTAAVEVELLTQPFPNQSQVFQSSGRLRHGFAWHPPAKAPHPDVSGLTSPGLLEDLTVPCRMTPAWNTCSSTQGAPVTPGSARRRVAMLDPSVILLTLGPRHVTLQPLAETCWLPVGAPLLA